MRKAITVVGVSVGIALVAAIVRLLALPPFELVDMKALDFHHAVRGGVAAGGEVVIVAIDEASLAEVGRWPWPRSRLAALIDALTAADVAVVGVDVLFDQPDDGLDAGILEAAIAADPAAPVGEVVARLRRERGNDARLADAFSRSSRVVVSHFFDFRGTAAGNLEREVARTSELAVRTAGGASLATAPLLGHVTQAHVDVPVLASAAAASGHINFLTDRDGIYRRAPLAIRVGDRAESAFSVEIVRRYLGGAAATLVVGPDGVTGLRVGSQALPVDAAAELWIAYLGGPGTVPSIPAADVLAGRVAADRLRGRIALIGFTAAGFDEIATPFAPVAPGVELQATVIDNLLHGTSLRRPWWLVPAEAFAILLLGAVVGFALRAFGAVGGTAAALGLALGIAWTLHRLFVDLRLAVGGVYPLGALVFCTLAAAVYRWFVEEREKREVRNAFRRYLNPEVTEMLAESPHLLRLGGERREITILFSDLRGFTSLSERLPPEQLSVLLNEYLGTMTDIVLRHLGLLDKYMGDGLMAFWGAPVPAPDGATRCCEAALDMVTALATLNARWREMGMPVLEMGVGINTGEAVIGNFGSSERFNYTAVGDQVNLASRLEGVTKDYGASVVVSESARQAAGDAFVCREIESVRVKGREQAVLIYELLGRTADDADGVLARRAQGYEEALGAYRQGAFDAAHAAVSELLREHPGDRAAAALRARCEQAAAPTTGEPRAGTVRRA
jgi:adenylate cyclase